MEKKSKKGILVGITSLFLVTLVLLGLTYAYYRTRIIGNESEEPSISVTSKKLEVVYQNESAYLEVTNIEPDNDVVYTKTFEVKNNGTEVAYYSVVLDEMVNTFERNELDWEYVLTKDGVTDPVATDFISSGSYQILVGKIAIDVNVTDKYTLTIKYKNQDVDQSEDMGASLRFRINISEEKVTWDNAEEGTLLYAIKKDNTVSSPLTKVGTEVSLETEALLAKSNDDYGTSYYFRGNVQNNYVNYAGMCWRIVRVMGDGTIKLILEDQNDICQNSTAETISWNIPANEDGTGKLGMYGITYNTEYQSGKRVTLIDLRHSTDTYYGSDGTMTVLQNFGKALRNFQKNKLADYTEYLEVGEWCIDDTAYGSKTGGKLTELEKIEIFQGKVNPHPNAKNQNKFWYGSYVRIDVDGTLNPSLECKGTKYSDWDDIDNTPMYVGGITAEEVVYAGAAGETSNTKYYLINGFNNITGWIPTNNKHQFYTLSPNVFYGNLSNVYSVDSTGVVKGTGAYANYGSYRPSVILKSDVTINTGSNGTQTNPYEVL